MNKIKKSWNKFSIGQKIGAILIGICIIAVIVASCSKPSSTTDSSSDDQYNTKQEQQKEEPAVEDKSEPEEEPEEDPEPKPDSDAELGSINNNITWKQYQFSKDDYKIALYNDDCMVLVKDIKTVGNTVKIKYSFYNESGNDDTPGWTLCSTLYQDGISNEDIEFGSEHGNEYNSIRSGNSVDDCYEYVTFDPSGSKDVEIDLGLFLSTKCTVLYNVDTEEFSIK